MSDDLYCTKHKRSREVGEHCPDCESDIILTLKEEITRLRAKLAEAEGQERVAWLIEECDGAQWLSFDKRCEHAQPLYTHPAPAKVPEGYALVPIEPTDEMLTAAMTEWDRKHKAGERNFMTMLAYCYQAMLKSQGGE